MKKFRKLFMRLLPLRAKQFCAFCRTGVWFVKRPELVYRGNHRYPRWQCECCGRTPQTLRRYAELRAVTLAAQAAGPGSPAWQEYERLSAYESE